MTKPELLIFGGGRAACALAVSLQAADWPFCWWIREPSRRVAVQSWWALRRLQGRVEWLTDLQRHQAPWIAVILAVPDRALAAVAEQAMGLPALSDIPLWFHMSGALPAGVLTSASSAISGASRGTMHPLAALADPVAAAAEQPLGDPLRGAFFALDGDAAAVKFASKLVESIGGLPNIVPAPARAAYHAAAALAANDVAALLDIACQTAVEAGLPEPSIRAGLLHLATTAIQALARVPAAAPLLSGATGAVVRGDSAVLAMHLQALGTTTESAQLHRLLSHYLLRRLQNAGQLDPATAAAVEAVLACSPSPNESA